MTVYDKAVLGRQAAELGFIRDTYEKVLRLTDVLGFINTDPLLRDSLALKGGTAIKLGADQIDKAAKTLKRLSKKLQAGGEQPPQFLMVLVGLGTFAHRREDGIIVVPIDTLGP
ncbi:MAG: hypothetical protein LBR20_03735, partial [Propionibacteriaceae bacterium]|jgi:hypothetical protein|nr:hypothetical protein [Propionibacteriaceae bacterium]